MNHRPFQEVVVTAWLDPISGLDMEVAAERGEQYPQHAFALKKFFNTLQNTLLFDEIWGPILERYQTLQLRQDVQKLLKERGFPTTPRDWFIGSERH